MLFKCSNVQSSEFRCSDTLTLTIGCDQSSILVFRISYSLLLTTCHTLAYQIISFKAGSTEAVCELRAGFTCGQHTHQPTYQRTTYNKLQTGNKNGCGRGMWDVYCGLWLMGCGFSHFTVHYKPPYSKSIKDMSHPEFRITSNSNSK